MLEIYYNILKYLRLIKMSRLLLRDVISISISRINALIINDVSFSLKALQEVHSRQINDSGELFFI